VTATTASFGGEAVVPATAEQRVGNVQKAPSAHAIASRTRGPQPVIQVCLGLLIEHMKI
jgi:hypothetical protein